MHCGNVATVCLLSEATFMVCAHSNLSESDRCIELFAVEPLLSVLPLALRTTFPFPLKLQGKVEHSFAHSLHMNT